MHVLYNIMKGIYQFVANRLVSGTFPQDIIKIGQDLT